MGKTTKCSTQQLDCFPVTIRHSGHYIVSQAHNFKCDQVAINVKAPNVKIEFCNNAKFTLGGESVGIKVKKNCFTLVGGNFYGDSRKAVAVKIGRGVKGFTIDHSKFNNFFQAITATDFKNGKLSHLDFNQCNRGFEQLNTTDKAERLKIEHIRGDYVDENPEPCPNPFTYNGPDINGLLEGINRRLSWAVSLNGRVINSMMKDLKLNGTSIYCFNCINSSIDKAQIHYEDIKCFGINHIQLGSPQRGAFLFRLFAGPPPEGERVGCENCRVTNSVFNTVVPPPIAFAFHVIELFCSNCILDNCQGLMAKGATFEEPKFGVGLAATYCRNCEIRNSLVSGPLLVGIIVCDIFNIGLFCEACRITNCKVTRVGCGFSLYRCHGVVLKDSMTSHCHMGVHISLGTTNAVVCDCKIIENCNGILYAISNSCNPECILRCLSDNFDPDKFPQFYAPCNGSVVGSVFSGNRVDIFEGPQDIFNPMGPKLNLYVAPNNIFVPCESGEGPCNCGVAPECDCDCLVDQACPP